MRQVGLNIHAAIMQNSQTNRKSYHASKDGSKSFDNILADKFSENGSQRDGNSSVTNKAMKKPSAHTNRSNQKDSIGTEEDTEMKKDIDGEDEKIEAEILLMIQSLEEILQLIQTANTNPEAVNIEDFHGMMNGLEIKINELLNQVEQGNLANGLGNKIEGIDFKSLQGMMQDVIDTMADVNHLNRNNIEAPKLEAMLAKLQDVLGEQVEDLQGIRQTSVENSPFKQTELNGEVSQGKELNQLKEPIVDLEESLRGNDTKTDTTHENSHENLEQGSEKQEGFFSGMKSNVEVINTQQQLETQFVKVDQTTVVEQAKSETTVTQTVKLNNIIDQVANKVMVQVGEEGSEMSLQLKPEHLGKLTMKVSIERGIVVASFVAESQMVKEVLESNFNLLKDALQEKGLSVQELNVFVGSDSNFQNHKNFMAFQRKTNKGNNSYNETSYGNSVEEITQISPRSLNSSKLDFFA